MNNDGDGLSIFFLSNLIDFVSLLMRYSCFALVKDEFFLHFLIFLRKICVTETSNSFSVGRNTDFCVRGSVMSE